MNNYPTLDCSLATSIKSDYTRSLMFGQYNFMCNKALSCFYYGKSNKVTDGDPTW